MFSKTLFFGFLFLLVFLNTPRVRSLSHTYSKLPVLIFPIFLLTSLICTFFIYNLNFTPAELSFYNFETPWLDSPRVFSLMTTWPFFFICFFITALTLIFCFCYNFQELRTFQLFIGSILAAGFFLFTTNSVFVFFFSYEALLIPSFIILYKFAKTRKAVEAAFLMFFWTQFGAIILIFAFQYLYVLTGSINFYIIGNSVLAELDLQFLFWTLLVGFGVKFPIWPFYDWLPKAHVEASTNFSIFLSGVLVKFAFFAFFKCMTIFGTDTYSILVYPFILIGFFDATTKIYYQTDLKKLVAYSTVIEMHWLLLAVIAGPSFFWIAGFTMMISHALTSASFFLIVDSLTRRFKTRLVGEVSGLFYTTPNLYFMALLFILVFLGFPGTLLFFSEFIMFTSLLDLNFLLFIVFFFFAYFFVPSAFFKSWFLVLFGFSAHNVNFHPVVDLGKTELGLLISILIILFWLGLSAQFIL